MINNIFIHFLDHEFINLFNLKKANKLNHIYQELRFATRLAFLVTSEKVIIPASNYFESQYAKQILDEIKLFGEYGFLVLASSSLTQLEFIENKRKQYNGDIKRFPLYFKNKKKLSIDSFATWSRRNHSATSDIAGDWKKSIGNATIWESCYKKSGCKKIEQFENVLAKIPERLESAAFIPDFVTPLLSWKNKESLTVKNHLNIIITSSYIQSFTNEFNASCMTDLPFFDTSILLPSDKIHIPVSSIKRIIYRYNKVLIDSIKKATGEKLLEIKFSNEWNMLLKTKIYPYIIEYNKMTPTLQSKRQEILDNLKRSKEKEMDIKSFIVHGQDNETKLELKNYLQNTLHLPEPIILHEQAGKGKTIIEKFETYAEQATVVFVLLTPDDKLFDASIKRTNAEKRRARQNVIFEMGFFMGMLKRDSGRVLLLYKKDVELPSDISGIVYIDITSGIEAAGEQIRRELSEIIS